MGGIGVFPGTFNPPTVGHLAVADAARRQFRLERLDLVLSETPIDKHGRHDLLPLDERVALVRAAVGDRPWAQVRTSPHRLIVDLARGYDLVVMGADKWAQVCDPHYYDGDAEARDAVLAALPPVAVAPRGDLPVPDDRRLEVPGWVGDVSATAVRTGRTEWHAPTTTPRPGDDSPTGR